MAKLKSERFLSPPVPPERESKSLGQIKIVGHRRRGQLAFDGRANGHGSSSLYGIRKNRVARRGISLRGFALKLSEKGAVHSPSRGISGN